MNRKYAKITILVMMFAVGVTAYAASIGIPCDGPDCQACHLVQLGQSLLTWFITIMTSIIAFMFAWGGIQMVMSAGNSEGISKGKSMMWNSLIGFVILLSSWLIVDTFLKMFMSGASYGMWHTVTCVGQPTKTKTTTTAPGTVTVPGKSTVSSEGKLSDGDARTLLDSAGIGVNKTEAQGTSLAGINYATIKDAIDLKNACNCAITISGGTESTGGHTTAGTMNHATGYKYDISMTPEVTKYIESSFTKIDTRSDGAIQYQDPKDGTIYAKEVGVSGGSHWDVKVSS